MKKLALLALVTLDFLYAQAFAEQLSSLTVNIISRKLTNGAGKEVDVSILKQELERLGHRVNLCDFEKTCDVNKADINLFLAQFRTNNFSQAKLNWFIPNAETCEATTEDLQNFDLVLCKTEESLRIFSPNSKEVFYLGFTSFDRYQPDLTKDFSKYFHLAGKSRMKGTGAVLTAWKNHLSFPQLTLIKHSEQSSSKTSSVELVAKTHSNVTLISKRISDEDLLVLQNQCGIHLCPSETEGFGHYIMEGMSVAGVVITTDAPPMNEFIKDKRCLVKYETRSRKKYADTYIVNAIELAKTVKRLQKLSVEELKTLGQQNREEYLKRKQAFVLSLEKLMNKALHDLNKSPSLQ